MSENKTDFKPGDLVKRIGNNYWNVKHGKLYTVKVLTSKCLYLEDVIGEYDPGSFKLDRIAQFKQILKELYEV